MVKTFDELLTMFKNIVGENDSDEVIEFIENLEDTVKNTDSEYNKEKFEELDKKWRKRFIDRFTRVEDIKTDEDTTENEDVTTDEETITVDDLFEEKEGE